jgi:hypothetical protein
MPVNIKSKASPMVRLAMPSPRAAPVNQSVAPVCPVSQSQAIPPQPPIKRPGLPPVQDLPSVINVLNQIIMMLNTGPDNYRETQRVTEVVRVYNPNDKEQWVDVERIMFTRLNDPVNGGSVVWEY